MVKTLSLGLLVAIMFGIASCAPAHAPQVTTGILVREFHKIPSPEASSPTIFYHYYQPNNFIENIDNRKNSYSTLNNNNNNNNKVVVKIEESDNHSSTVARSERSANLSHIPGTTRKIQIFIKNFHLQILPDGTVNGTLDDKNIYTILQRTAVGIGKLKIQGVGTCQYLCMDACGLLYGSREFNDECVFNEMIQQHHYNTYSSTKYSNDKRTSYLAFNRRGVARKVLLHAGQPLGRLSSFTRVLTRTVPQQKVEEVLHPMRHHAHMCAATKSEPSSATNQQHANNSQRCRRHKKRKKKRRKCQPPAGGGDGGTSDDSIDGDQCNKRQMQGVPRKSSQHHNVSIDSSISTTSHNNISFRNSNNSSVNTSRNSKCEMDDNSDECQRVDLSNNNKKFVNAKTKYGDKIGGSGGTKKKNKLHNGNAKGINKHGGGAVGAGHRKRLKTTQTPPITTTLMDDSTDDDYAIDSTTTFDWDDSTMMPLPEESGSPHPD